VTSTMHSAFARQLQYVFMMASPDDDFVVTACYSWLSSADPLLLWYAKHSPWIPQKLSTRQCRKLLTVGKMLAPPSHSFALSKEFPLGCP